MASAMSFDVSDGDLVENQLAGSASVPKKPQQKWGPAPHSGGSAAINSSTSDRHSVRVSGEYLPHEWTTPTGVKTTASMTDSKQPSSNILFKSIRVVVPTLSTEFMTSDARNRKNESRRKRRRTAGNGLRQFAEDVLRKVERKGQTTYNEVADELVADSYRATERQLLVSEEKNIRRRVYDALNVLIAMKIITKEKKLIKWSGMPANQTEQVARLEKHKLELQKRVKGKRLELNELIVQQVAFANLIERNRERIAQDPIADADAIKLHLPFIVVNTRMQTSVDCWMSSNRDTYVFNFNDRFEMHDDVEVLKRSGLAVGLESGKCHGPDLERALKFVDINLRPYIIEMALKSHLLILNKRVVTPPGESVTSLTMSSAIRPASGYAEKDKDLDSVVISRTLQQPDQDVACNYIVENTKHDTFDVNVDDSSSSDEPESDDDDSAFSNHDDSDIEPSI